MPNESWDSSCYLQPFEREISITYNDYSQIIMYLKTIIKLDKAYFP